MNAMVLTGGHRRRARVVVDLAVAFMTTDDGRTFAGVARDFSFDGLFVASRDVLPIGAVLVIVMSLFGHQLALPGTVRWQRPDGMGIELGPLGERECAAISQFLAWSLL